MQDCIFCHIVKGDLTAHKIYEDDHCLAFLDIAQIVDGHTMLIPKEHHRWIWDIPDIGRFYETARDIIKHFQEVTSNEFVMSVSIGQLVPHAHLHLLPSTMGSQDLVLKAWETARNARSLKEEDLATRADQFKYRP